MAVPGGPGRAVRPGPGLPRGRPGDLLLRADRGHPGDVPPDRRRRRRGEPQLRARRVHRRVPGLPGRPGTAGVRQLDAGHRAEPVLRAGRGEVRGHDAGLVPDGRAHAGGAVLRHQERPAAGRPAGAAARAGLAVGRADPRAEQPGRGRGAGHRHAARPGGRDAAQAGHDRPGQLGPARPGDPGPAAGGGGGTGVQGARADPDGGVRPGGRGGRLAGRITAATGAGSSRPRSSRAGWTRAGWTRWRRWSTTAPWRAPSAG